MKFPVLHELNLKLNANIVDFHGWQMPVFYSSILNEYNAVREKLAVFDVSHMGRFMFTGTAAEAFLDYLTTNNLRNLKAGKALYTCLLNHAAGIIDDLIIYKFNSEKFLLINNAGNHQAVSDWFAEQFLEFGENNIKYEDITAKIAQIAVQGPLAKALINNYFKLSEDIPYFSFRSIDFNGEEYIISATGYTGEAGYEIYAKPDLIRNLVNDLEPLVLAGLGARDVLRLEAGYCLHGNDISLDTNPYEASLDWVVKLDKDFIGKEKLLESLQRPKKKLVGLLFPVSERIIPRAGTKVYLEEAEIGHISSGTFSFILNRGIALAYLENLSQPNFANLKRVSIKIRRDVFNADIIEPWFYRNIRGKEIQSSEIS